MEKILITGSNGFLGESLVNYFKKSEHIVAGIDKIKVESPKYLFHHGKVSIESILSFNLDFDLIIHCAGSGSISFSFNNPMEDFDMTVESVRPVLEYMRVHNLKARMIYPSSAAVYGSKQPLPIKETDSTTPESPYGFHKRIVYELCESYYQNFGVKTNIIRFFSLYGTGLRKQLFWDACNQFKKKQSIARFSGTGDEIRDWLNIGDSISLIDVVCKKNIDFDIVNGGGYTAPIKSIVNLIKTNIGAKQQIYFDGIQRKGDPKYYIADKSKAISYGWQPKVKIEDGVKEYVSWFKAACAE